MNFYDEESLKIASHPEMQKLFRERMGEWKAGDRYHCPNDNPELFHKAKIIEDGYFDSMKYDSEGKLGSFVNPEPCCPDVCIRLPLPIDPGSPERGLWVMCDGVVTIGKQLFIKGSYFVSVRLTDSDGNYKKFISFKGHSPAECLLKALAYQIGVEVNNVE